MKKAEGLTTLKVKIFKIEKEVDIYIIDGYKYDFLIGLDMIKEFRLSQDMNLEISQNNEPIENSKENISTLSENEQPTKKENSRNTCGKVNKDNIEKYEVNFNEHIPNKKFEIEINHLSLLQQNKVDKLIDEYKSSFAKDKYDIGTVKNFEARIDLIVDKYCRKRPYRCTWKDREEIEKQITKLLDAKLIEESYSPFAAPVTLAFKREENEKTRLCIDFRELNKIVIPQAQPFPRIEDLAIKARDCKNFSTLDINSAFWSIPVRIEDRSKTAFVTEERHLQWTCLPYGLKTASAIFQRILSNILRKYNLTDFATNYIDDILIFSKTFEEHMDHLKKLLEAIQKEGFKLKFTKCRFAAESAKYLGHFIQHNSIQPLTDNLVSIKEFPTPKTQKNVRSFLGKINYYHEYIPKITLILEPLHNLLRKEQKFIWSEKCQKAFDTTKQLLCSKPILAIYSPDLPTRIYTDASLEGIAAILKQVQEDDKEKPVAYFSKKLNESQKKKKAVFLECLAIKEAVSYWKYWLMGKSFIVYTDHKPLENLNLKARTDEELGNLTYYLSQFEIKIKYKPGKTNLEADCLSRNPVLEAEKNYEEELKFINMIKLSEIQIDQSQNQDVQKNKKKLIKDKEIYYKRRKKNKKIIISEELSLKLIKEVHENLSHIGTKQMQMKINPVYTAKNLTKNIRKQCKNCEICIKNKSRGQEKLGLMSHLGPATKPYEIISVDTIGGFGSSRSTKKYMHLLVDHFTRYASILTSKTQSANDFTKLVKQIPERGNIKMLLTDQYPGINSKEFKTFLKEEHIQIVFTAVNSPFSNGLNERLNQTLVNKIRCSINEKKKKVAWTTIAHECVNSYNNTEHSVTGFAPNYLLNGTDISILPNELRDKNRKCNLNQDRQTAFENSLKSHNYNKTIFDKNRKHHEFHVGDLVYVENGNKLNRKKLDELKIGPYAIIEKLSSSIYKIDVGHKKAESSLFHITKLTPIQTATGAEGAPT